MSDWKVEARESKYKYPSGDFISGFGVGSGYEVTCQNMVTAGMEWFDANPKADPKFHGYKHIYGIIEEDNEDAKALSAAVVKAGEGCSGAMHQATISHILYAHKHGWDAYLSSLASKKGEAR